LHFIEVPALKLSAFNESLESGEVSKCLAFTVPPKDHGAAWIERDVLQHNSPDREDVSCTLEKSDLAVVAAALVLSSSVVSAAIISEIPVTQDVSPGDTVTVDIVATDLINATGGSMDVTWDSTVLSMNSVVPLTDAEVNIADVAEGDGPWDDPDSWVGGSAYATSFSRIAQRSLALRPAHSPSHLK